MRSRLRFWKYPISIVLLLLVVAAFTLVYILSETAEAPYDHIGQPTPVIVETPDPSDDPFDDPPTDDPINDPVEPDPDPDPDDVFVYNPAEDGFITINMEDADIHRGYLLLVNHDHEFTIPGDLDLVNISTATTTQFRVQPDNARIARSIIEPLDEMMDDFLTATNNRSVAIISAYRNRETQQRILNNYISRMGRREALRWAAYPGHSEHHTGLAFDFGIISGGSRSTFTGTGSSAWFRRNSFNYGFILRYQQNKTHITQTANEPWHFRFVGLPHSIIIHQNNWCLEEYIEIIRDYTMDEPFIQEIDDVIYEIYFSASTDVPIPINSEFDISGNNVDGFIITVVRLPFDPDNSTDFSI